MDKYNQDNVNIVLEDEPLRSEGTQTVTEEEQRTSTSSARIYDVIGSKPKGRPITDASSDKRKVQCCKKSHTIGTWNVRTMNQGKLDVVKGEMSRLNIDILGISELKWTGMGHFISDGYHVFYCGHESHRRNGVAIIVNKKLNNSILGYNPKSDRLISIRLLGKPINVTIIQVYAPTTGADDAEIEDFYVSLQQFVDATPKKDAIFIIGDWNAKVGNQVVAGVTGKFGLGERNEAGDRLVEFCQNYSLFITNTCFKQPKRRLYTWTSPNGQYRNQIDYILCSQRWKSSIQLAKTRPGADCGSDHELLITKFQMKLKATNKTVQPARYNLNNIPHEYTVKVKNRFDGLDLMDRAPDELWSEVRDIIKDEANKNITNKKTSKKAKWLTDDTLKVADKRRKAKGNGNKSSFIRLNAEFQRRARRDKEKYMNGQCQQIEDNYRKGKTKDLFKKIDEIKTKFHAKVGTIRDKQGRDLTDKEDIKKRWLEYTEDLYIKDTESIGATDSSTIELEPDILESEVKWALDNIAKNKAAGIDEIPIELFKILGDDAVKIMLAICQQIWRKQEWPSDWKKSIFVPILKKGSAKECSNYRTIALISHASKIMLKILQARLEQYMTRELPDVQAGFRSGRGTRDHIANIRWIMEKAREFQKDIYFCFIDYQKAFDCVDHNKLWTVLNNMGIPKHLTYLVKNLYTDQEASVRTDYGLTDWFKVEKGVRQGCVLSPCLFNLYAEYVMRNAEIDEIKAGVKVAGRNINNLRYADDTTLLAETEEDLKTLMMRVKEESAKAGLLLNIRKTKIMSTGNVVGIQIDGDKIETVSDFIFLGSQIHRDGDCSHEIKRRLLLGRKAMTNLDKILKSRDITVPTKVRIVKTMVFPVVTYGSESWIIKKADQRKIDAFELWCWRRLLRIPWTARRTNRSILSEIKPDCSLEASILKLKLKYFGHIMRRQDQLEKTLMLGKIEGSRKRGRQKIRWLDTVTDAMGKSLQELKQMVNDRQAWRTNVYQVTKSRNRLND